MKLNPKVTGGLAWAGLIVILAVPSVDMLTGEEQGAPRVTPVAEPVRTSTIAPLPTGTTGDAKVETASVDAVDSYLSTGKKLPSYISDAPAEVASTKPAPVAKLAVPSTPTTAPAKPAVEVASLPSTSAAPTSSIAAPVPYPASKRPAAPVVATAAIAPAEEAPLIIDEAAVARRDAAVAAVLDDPAPLRPSSGIVTGDQLEEWDSGSLAEYLERRGLMSGSNEQASAEDYDPDGFFLDEGSNNREGARVVRRLPRRNNDFFFF